MNNGIWNVLEEINKRRDLKVSEFCKGLGVDFNTLSESDKELYTNRYFSEQEACKRKAEEAELKTQEQMIALSWERKLSNLLERIPKIFKFKGVPELEDFQGGTSVVAKLIRNGASLLIFGENGVGKSHLAWASNVYFTRQKKTVLQFDMFELKSMLTSMSMSGGDMSRMILKILVDDCDVLIVDEVEKISMTDALYQNFSYLINKRYERLKQTILLGNGTYESMEGLLGKSITSRFHSDKWNAQMCKFSGRDRRAGT